jgi:2'-5' RNA ligase
MYTVMAMLPHNLVTALEPHRQKFDPQANIIPPHITIVAPFEFSGSLTALYDHLDSIGETHAPIKVTLVGWDADTQAGYHLHLPLVAGQSEFIALRQHLLTGPLYHLAEMSADYRPHITLGRFSKESDLIHAKQALKGFEPQFTFNVTHLVLWQRAKPTEVWRRDKQISLEATILSRRNRLAVKIA